MDNSIMNEIPTLALFCKGRQGISIESVNLMVIFPTTS